MKIVVPTIVLQEFERRFLREASTRLGEYRRQRGRLEQFWSGASGSHELPDDPAAAAAEAFANVRARILEHAEEAPLPRVDHGDLVRADLEHRKPFKQSGEGYRDALIWHTLLEVGQGSEDGEVWFVSNNSKDFGTSKGSDVLAEELVKEAASVGLQVNWVWNLEALVDCVPEVAEKDPTADSPTEPTAAHRPDEAEVDITFIDAIPEASRQDAVLEAAVDAARTHLGSLDIDGWPHSRNGSASPLRDILDIPFEVEDAEVTHVEFIDTASPQLIDDGYEDAELWQVTIRAVLSLTGYAHKADWESIEEYGTFWVYDGDWNDHVMWVDGTATVEVAVSVLVDTANYVLGVDVDSVEAAQ